MTGEGDHTASTDLAAALAAAEAWWREAGVTGGYVDTPRDWLAAAREAAAPPPPAAARRAGRAAPPDRPAAPAPIGGDPARWPAELAGWNEWWLGEPGFAIAGSGGRVPPRGPAAPALMVLVPQPEAGDGERLLNGPQGRLLDAILAALGVAGDAAYVASVVPAHVGPIDWALLAERGMGAVLAHHIGLVAPGRLLVFGREGVSSLLDHASPQAPASSPQLHHDSLNRGATYLPLLDGLLERPRRKAQVWKTLLDGQGL